MNLTHKKILLTGGAGFVGSHLVDLLLQENPREVIVLDNFLRGKTSNLTQAKQHSNFKLVVGDIRNLSLLHELFHDVDYCFHLAALRITRCAEDPQEATEVMLNGTKNILDMCVKFKVKKLVLSSTASVYGQAEIFPTPEDHHPYHNHTYYGAMKIANELMCRSYADMYDLNYLALRYFNIYGPRMDTEGKYTEVAIRWMNAIQKGEAPIIFGDGKQSMDFIYVKDVARANLLALKSPLSDQVYNIASGVETSLSQLAELLLQLFHSSLLPKHVPLPLERQKVEVARRMASTVKAEQELQFKAQTSLATGLQELIRWHREENER